MRFALAALLLAACVPDPLALPPADGGADTGADVAADGRAPPDVPPDVRPPVCTPGAQVACACVGGAAGAQVCAGDGASLGPCMCPDGGVADGGSDAGDDVLAVDAVDAGADVLDVPMDAPPADGGVDVPTDTAVDAPPDAPDALPPVDVPADTPLDRPCSTSLATDPNNCGACGVVCLGGNHAVGRCNSSACAMECLYDYGNCDGNAANGCETNIFSDINCGACGRSCAPAHGAGHCARTGAATPYRCAVSSCDVGFSDCDGDGFNGCESNRATDPMNCGSCTNACSFPHSAPTCSSGTCVLGTCEDGYGNCDGMATNGCETSLRSTSNCGACGVRCTGGLCLGGRCT